MTGSELPETISDRGPVGSTLCYGRPWMGYALAVVAVALAAVLRWVLVRALGEFPPFVTFFPMVVLVAMLLGGRAGVMATLLSAAVASCFFFPRHQLLTLGNTVHAVLFMASGLLVSLMAELLDRARRRQAVSERESLLQAMSEGIPDPLFLKDRDSRIIVANAATVRAIGKPAKQIVGHTDEEFYDDPAVGAAMTANDRRVMEAGQAETLEEFVPGLEGRRTFLSIKTPWRDVRRTNYRRDRLRPGHH